MLSLNSFTHARQLIGRCQVFLDETQERLEESLARVSILSYQRRGDRGVRAVDRHADGPVVGIDVAQEDTARYNLIIEYHLTVISPIDARELVVARGENRGDSPRPWERDERVVAQLGR